MNRSSSISYCFRFLLISLGLAAGTAQAAPTSNDDGFRTSTTNTMAVNDMNGAFGSDNILVSRSLAVGDSNTVSNSSFAAGLFNHGDTTNFNLLLAGTNNYFQSQTASAALGEVNYMIFPSGKTGGSNISLGRENIIDATGIIGSTIRETVLIGTLNDSAESNAYVFGSGHIGQTGTVTLGWCSDPVANASLVLGNGTFVINGTTRSNALVVLKNGDASIQGTLTVGGVSPVLASYLTTNNYLQKTGGSGASAGANALLANGMNASAGGSGSVALGSDSNGSNTDSFAFGNSSLASGEHSVAWGNDATASGSHSFAFGSQSSSTDTGAIAFGDGAKALGIGSVALGKNTNALEDGSTAVGVNASAGAAGATAWGWGTSASGARAVAVGATAKASKVDSIAIGPGASAESDGAIVIGAAAEDMGPNITVIGSSYTVATYLRGETNLESLKVPGEAVLGGQVKVHPATSPGTNALRVLANGTVLIKRSGDLPMDSYTSGEMP